MGNLLSPFISLFNFQQDKRILLLGLDAAGKTTFLYKLRLGETVHTIPTIGFNVEKVQYKNIEFTMWDIGGQEKIRPLWKHYYQGTDAVIFVVDSNDRERVEEAAEELQKLLSEEPLKNACVLVYANKQDLPNALSVSELTTRLGMYDIKSKPWFVQSCVASRGDGLYEGLEWLSAQLKKQKTQH